MSKLSAADQQNLNADQQKEILRLKQDWETAHSAGDRAAMEQANRDAEAIRASAGYAGGQDGSGYQKLGQNGAAVPQGAGKSAQEVRQWVEEYRRLNRSDSAGWTNGFSGDMNHRSMANYIRQQMEANSQAWAKADEAGKAYLHQQNLELAKILADATGGAQSTYNEQLGRWETDNANLGYGYNVGFQDADFAKQVWGMTDEQIEQYRRDTQRYRNYVDQQVIRNWVDESSGYTGDYAQFANGPYAALMMGDDHVNRATYIDLMGDGEGVEGYAPPMRDAQGNVIPRPPYRKNNNQGMTDYTRQFASYVDENGVIQPGELTKRHPGAGFRGTNGTNNHARTPNAYGDRGRGPVPVNRWEDQAGAQAVLRGNYQVDQAVAQLLRAQEEQNALYQTQRDQIAREERTALDNAALYAEARGDRGGIGQAQYNQIQAQAAANRQKVSDAQVKLAEMTKRQIAQLRAEGEFKKADALLEISQTYLLKLLELEKWAAQHQVADGRFDKNLRKWEEEFGFAASANLI